MYLPGRFSTWYNILNTFNGIAVNSHWYPSFNQGFYHMTFHSPVNITTVIESTVLFQSYETLIYLKIHDIHYTLL